MIKATGMIRNIDRLGRIVIPKQILLKNKLFVGTPLEIFIEEGGPSGGIRIMLQPYQPGCSFCGNAGEKLEPLLGTTIMSCPDCKSKLTA